jgi:hypothetical protein
MIVAEGLAWWYKRYAPKDADLKDAENDARSSKKGLWSHPNPIPPWKFRRQKASKDGEYQREMIQSNVSWQAKIEGFSYTRMAALQLTELHY